MNKSKQSLIAVLLLIMQTLFGYAAETPAKDSYQPKSYTHLLGMSGFSDQLLNLHFQLYQGYVKNANLLLNRLQEMRTQDQMASYEFGALKRRLGWEMDGMRLHELYFGNLGGANAIDSNSSLARRLLREFGSYEEWKRDFIATGSMRGIGWVILYKDPQTGRLINAWINEHDVGHLAGGTPLLVMDVFEHAYMPQYGLDKAKYIEAFFNNINWAEVQKRYTQSK